MTTQQTTKQTAPALCANLCYAMLDALKKASEDHKRARLWGDKDDKDRARYALQQTINAARSVAESAYALEAILISESAYDMLARARRDLLTVLEAINE